MSEIKRVELLKEELELMKGLKELAEHNPQDLENESLSSLLSLFSQRKSILKKISRCQEKMDKAGGLLPGAGEEDELFELIVEIKSAYADIARLDRELGQRLGQERGQVLEKMRQTRHGRRILKGYSSGATSIPRYCDKKG